VKGPPRNAALAFALAITNCTPWVGIELPTAKFESPFASKSRSTPPEPAEPVAVVVARDQGDVRNVEIFGGHVYWVSDHEGPLVARGTLRRGSLAASAGDTNTGDTNTVDTSAVEDLWKGGHVHDFAVHDWGLVVLHLHPRPSENGEPPQRLSHVSLDGQTQPPLVPELSYATFGQRMLSLDDTHAYWVNSFPSATESDAETASSGWRVSRVPRGGGAAETLAKLQYPHSVGVTAGQAVFCSAKLPGQPGPIVTLDLATRTQSTIAQAASCAMAVSKGRVFFSPATSPNSVVSLRLDGSDERHHSMPLGEGIEAIEAHGKRFAALVVHGKRREVVLGNVDDAKAESVRGLGSEHPREPVAIALGDATMAVAADARVVLIALDP
jgi:hypothetical protein